MLDLTLLKALSDETRLKIIDLLISRSYCGRALSCKLGISEAAVSQHLKVLKNVNLLIGDKKGYFVHYRVNRDTLSELANSIASLTNHETMVSCMVQPCDCAEKGSQKCKCMDRKKTVKAKCCH